MSVNLPLKNQNESRVTVNIYGEEYVVRGNASPEHIEKLASQVNEKMRMIFSRNPNLSPNKVAVLTALNLADELAHLQEDYNNLIQLLDNGLEEEEF